MARLSAALVTEGKVEQSKWEVGLFDPFERDDNTAALGWGGLVTVRAGDGVVGGGEECGAGEYVVVSAGVCASEAEGGEGAVAFRGGGL